MDELTQSLESAWTWVGSLGFSFGNVHVGLRRIVLLALLVVVVVLLARWIERAVQKLGKRFADGDGAYPAAYAFGRILKYVVLILGGMFALDTMGLDVSKLALIGGAIGVGVGFGLQNIVSNFVSGIILLTERSLKVGDFVDLQSGVRGKVVEIAMRFTRVSTNDLVDILVPNSEFVNGRVTNWTFDEFSRRIHVPFGVAYGTDKERVKAAGIAAAKRITGIIVDDPRRAPDVWLVGFGDSALNFELVAWVTRALVTSPGRTEARILWAIDDEMRAANIEIPFPQRDLHVRSGALRVHVDSPDDSDRKRDRVTDSASS